MNIRNPNLPKDGWVLCKYPTDGAADVLFDNMASRQWSLCVICGMVFPFAFIHTKRCKLRLDWIMWLFFAHGAFRDARFGHAHSWKVSIFVTHFGRASLWFYSAHSRGIFWLGDAFGGQSIHHVLYWRIPLHLTYQYIISHTNLSLSTTRAFTSKKSDQTHDGSPGASFKMLNILSQCLGFTR